MLVLCLLSLKIVFPVWFYPYGITHWIICHPACGLWMGGSSCPVGHGTHWISLANFFSRIPRLSTYEEIYLFSPLFSRRTRPRIWNVWHFGEPTCQTATIFIKCNCLKISTIRQMFYIHCCMLGFIHYLLVINLLQSKNRSIEALLFPKK